MDKTVGSTRQAVADIMAGSSVAVGGFGLCGIPEALIESLLEQGADDLHIVSNNCGVDTYGLGMLLTADRITRTTGSYIGGNAELERQYLGGRIEVELTPQGTLAERLRAGGSGIPAFYTPAGVGTQVSDGGLPIRYDRDGRVVLASTAKEIREFEGQRYVLEHAIRTDFALVHARYGDRHGNLVYEKTAANFNPLCAAAGRITVAQVEHIVSPGELNPALVHTPGIFVQRVVHVPNAVKHIEKASVSRS